REELGNRPSPIYFSASEPLGSYTALDPQDCGGNPRIVTREEWGARPPSSSSSMPTPVPFVIIHHTVTSHCFTVEACIPVVRQIQNYHMDTNGWEDIGYRQGNSISNPRGNCHFLVGEDGNVYEGRGWDKVGTHTPGFNSRGIAISVMGNFMEVLPNSAALTAIERLIECGTGLGMILGDYSLMGHRQASDTLCPGDFLFDEIETWGHFDPSPEERGRAGFEE
ncbi:unnamed protein product, partial [Darwinula stevensoni]